MKPFGPSKFCLSAGTSCRDYDACIMEYKPMRVKCVCIQVEAISIPVPSIPMPSVPVPSHKSSTLERGKEKERAMLQLKDLSLSLFLQEVRQLQLLPPALLLG